ncbi:MAG: NAD(P)-dependent oxidoreductase [Acidobacteria bacterium]|nr:NAD(P)-dependent oxidoreductase [Acidobacteriota bacterium]MCI0722137.1 NAD(P)-dependent oxidoreductase [Acidobacteriota bacterium]
MSDTVLVTGGSGFIGTHLCRSLVEKGDKVINFDLYPRQGPLAWLMQPIEKEIVLEKGDVANLSQLIAVMRKQQPNKIAHLAASIDMESMDSYPMQGHDKMVGGTVNLLEATRLLGGVDRLVNFSSIGVLPTRQYEPIDCDHPTLMAAEGPASGIYGAGKVAGEAFCWAYADLFNLDIVQLRPSAAYGFFTSNSIFINDMLEGALRGERVRVPHGRYLPRDYTHVHDIAGIAVAALNAPASQLRHRVFYAASGMNPLVNGGQVADIVREMIPGADVEIGETMTPMIERYDLKMRGVHDVRPVEEQLGYRIQYRDVRAGMKEYADRHCEFLISQGKTPAKRAW